jgi:hypothetical protein
MGFVKPTLPQVPIEEFRRLDRRDRIRVSVQDWVDNGFGTPKAILLVYVLKIVGYVVGGAAIIAATTPGLGGLSEIGTWWTEPIVLQKAVLWTLAFEVLGLGCGFGPLTFHFMPPLTAPIMWLRPGTTRLAPWPDRVPFTAGHTRTIADVVLYLAVVGATFWAMTRPGDLARVAEGSEVGLLDPVVLVPLLVLLPLLGLRDKAIFLAARSEQYLVLVAVFLFAYPELLTGAKWVLVATWWGAATSKLNQHFPYVVSTMLTNAPLRPRAFRRAMFRRYPEDLRPSKLAGGLAHSGTVIEFTVPALMVLGGGGTLTRIGVVVMVIFHLHIISALPLGVPLEWNVFFIYATVYLFWVQGEVPMLPGSPALVVFLLAALVAVPVLGNLRPDLVSFLPAMRYYAGNWATSLWLMSPEGERRFHEGLRKVSPSIHDQLAYLYDEETIDFLTHKSYAFRSMHAHGRALNGLERRAVDDPERYSRHEGEIVAGLALGWNFGEGHLHDESLVAALQAQCGFAPGDVRVVFLESQPIGDPHQEYRIIDAATGEVERGTVAVADMVARQPWLDDQDLPFPVDVHEPRPSAGRT